MANKNPTLNLTDLLSFIINHTGLSKAPPSYESIRRSKPWDQSCQQSAGHPCSRASPMALYSTLRYPWMWILSFTYFKEHNYELHSVSPHRQKWEKMSTKALLCVPMSSQILPLLRLTYLAEHTKAWPNHTTARLPKLRWWGMYSSSGSPRTLETLMAGAEAEC